MDEPPLLAHAASRDVNRMVIRPARMRIGGTPLVAITINAIARCNRPETGAPGDVGCGLSPCRTPGTTPRTAPRRSRREWTANSRYRAAGRPRRRRCPARRRAEAGAGDCRPCRTEEIRSLLQTLRQKPYVLLRLTK